MMKQLKRTAPPTEIKAFKALENGMNRWRIEPTITQHKPE